MHTRKYERNLMLMFDHIGVVVPSLSEGRAHLSALCGVALWTVEFVDPDIGVRVQFGRDGSGFCYETIAPEGAHSPIETALRRGERVLNHVAYRVDDITLAAAEFRHRGCTQAGPAQPAVAYCGKPVQFFVSPLRFLIELIEAPEHAHAYIEF